MVYNILCVAHVQFQEISHSLIDTLYSARSRQASRAIDLTRSHISLPNDLILKEMILDDVVETQVLEDLHYTSRWMYAFLFKEHLLLCTALDEEAKETDDIQSAPDHESLSDPYPVTSWDLGPALRSNKRMAITVCISLHRVRKIAIPEHSKPPPVLLHHCN